MAGGPEESAVLNALPDPVLVVGDGATIHYANQAAEQFFQLGAAYLRQRTLADLIAADSPLLRMIEQARRDYASLCSGEVEIDSPRTGLRLVTAQVSLLSDAPLRQVVMLHERTVAMQIDRQLIHRHAARSVSGLAAVLAHEVKNPLSGIRGAAQLLEQGASEGDRELTTLIRDEADRIVALVDRMEVFSDNRPVDKTAVNIHRVLEHVRRVAQTGFAGHVRFVEQYDPSLPPVLGNRDQLIQVFLNLVKNAAEAVPAQGGEILLSTAYRHGVRLAIAGQDQQQLVPLVVTVQDNGSGIPEDVRDHLFEAFVTTKKKGQGLGLALVAKIVGDHGGLIDVDSQPRRTQVRVLLPMVTDGG